MIRSTMLFGYRPQWIAAALVSLALVACGGDESKSDDSSRTVSSTQPAATPVIPAGGPTVTSESAASASGVVTFEDAESAFKEGRYDEATKLFERYVASKPENPFGHYMLGLSSWKSGDLVAAEHAFDRAIEKDPKHVKSLLNSARVLMDLGRNSEALERVNAARSLDSTSSDALRLLARAHHRLGNIESALEAYRDALTIDERDTWAMNNLGMLYIEEKDPHSALGPLARAVELRPASPIFQNNLGMALELVGDLTQAKSVYDAAVKADTGYAKARSNARRLGDVVVDSTTRSTIDVKEFAELFRQQIKLWKDSTRTPQ